MGAPEETRRRKPRAVHDTAVLREARAVELRSLGWSYDMIASALLPCPEHQPKGDRDCERCQRMYATKAGAFKAVQRALAREYDTTSEGAQALKRHQLAQIDLLLRAAMPAAIGRDWQAMREARHLLDRRARLLGLDAPQRHVVTSELDAEIEAMMDQLADAERRALTEGAGDA